MAIVISGVNNNDKITAADGTIDLLSGVNYAGIITAPAFTTPGNLTSGHLNVGSNIQLGNAGVATATTFVGNLTGNVNATSNLLLQIGGSEKFRVASSGQLGIGGANYGTSGQVLTSGGSGSAASWSTIPTPDADKIIEGNTKAEVIDTGSAGYFIVETEGSERLRIKSNGQIILGSDGTNSELTFSQDGTSGTILNSTTTGFGGYNTFTVNSAQFVHKYGSNERLRINSSGDLLTQGLTSPSFDNQGSNGRKYEFTGDGTAGKFPVINISGNSNTDGGTIGVIRFVNRENANSSSGNNNQSKGLFEFDFRSTTNDSNAGDDSGGYLRFITKDEGDVMSERFVLTAKGRFKSNGRENLGGIRERTSGVLANGESVSWNGSGTTYTNAALNWNSMGGNGGGWIGCLSVTAADGAPSGALVLVGIHGSGFNNYNMLQNSFDGGISVTPTGTGAGSNFWNSVISNTSGDTVYYRMLVYHLGTLASTVYGL